MSNVFVNIGLSLDGYMAPEGMAIEHWDTQAYKNWGAKWGALMGWVLKLEYFRETLKLNREVKPDRSMTCFAGISIVLRWAASLRKSERAGAAVSDRQDF